MALRDCGRMLVDVVQAMFCRVTGHRWMEFDGGRLRICARCGTEQHRIATLAGTHWE